MPEGPLIEPADLRGRVLLDCRKSGYEEGHLEGAHHADLETDLSKVGDAAVGGRHPLPDLDAWRATLGRWGIGRDTSVAVYDAKGGGLYAARAWWMLRAVGHRYVTVVDGGFAAAVGAGHPVTRALPAVDDVGPYPTAGWMWATVDAAEVDRRRLDPDWRVVDARSSARHRGQEEPIDPVAGRIEGSINLPWESMVGPSGRMLPPDQLRSRFSQVLGAVPVDRVIAQCGSGVTACHTLLALEVAGRGPAALYVGSFSEWCRQGRPIGRD